MKWVRTSLPSIPYLNILAWSGADLPRYWAMLIGVMPLMRAFLALYVVVQWLVDNKIRRLFTAYIFTVVVFTYISALVFYDYEILVNDKLHGFGNALWWAWMNVTTVGAEIFAVTAIGKVITILLPTLGMMMFPIFTVYITNLIHASVDPKTVQYLAGHESSKITMDIYAKVKYNRPEQLAGVLEDAFASWD